MSVRVREASDLAGLLSDRARRNGSGNAFLAGISGIDASGKGWLADRLTEELSEKGIRVARITVDAWLSLPEVRFSDTDPGGNFYRNGLRLGEMFQGTVLPLKRGGCVDVSIEALEETATDFERRRIFFEETDLILLEGIFIFARQYRDHFDLRVWVDCPFETAIERAVARSQEGLEREETVTAYERVYFPAQRVHFAEDDPVSAADIIFENG